MNSGDTLAFSQAFMNEVLPFWRVANSSVSSAKHTKSVLSPKECMDEDGTSNHSKFNATRIARRVVINAAATPAPVM
jgi:hypothetical protein